MNLVKTVLTFDDGSTQEFACAPAAAVAEAEIAKVESEVAAVDAELKADEVVA